MDRSGCAGAAGLSTCEPYTAIIAGIDATQGNERPMFGNLLGTSMMDDSGTTAMKYALIAVLLVLAVYHG